MRSAHLEMLRATLRSRVLGLRLSQKCATRAPRADHTALRVTGGIGDLVLSMGPAEALNRCCGDLVLYSKWPDIAELFTDLPCRPDKDLEPRGLDLIINLNSLCIFQFARNWRGFHNPALEQIYVANQEFLKRPGWKEIAKHHPYLDNVMGRLGTAEGLTRYEVTFASLGLPVEHFRRPMKWPAPTKQPYVTIHDGFDINNRRFGAQRATKTWSIKRWRHLIDLIHFEYPGLHVVQLGGPTSRRVPGVDLDNVGAIPFGESLRWLQHSLCHFDGDSGIMHSAHALGVRTVALYGPTPVDFFGYRDNVNLGPGYCGDCWWLIPEWVSKCAMGYETPECMDSISAPRVFQAFQIYFGKTIQEALCKTNKTPERTLNPHHQVPMQLLKDSKISAAMSSRHSTPEAVKAGSPSVNISPDSQ